MSTPSRMPICSTKILTICFALYAALNLVSMATMGISAFILIIAIALSGPQFPVELRSEWKHPPFKFYCVASFALTCACALSLITGEFFPLGYGGKFVQVHFFKDMAKVWYFFWPCILVIGLRRLSPHQRRTVLNTWILAFGLLSAIGILQYFFGWPRPQPIPGEPGHFHATLFLGHHLSVASIFIFPFFVTLDLVNLSYQQTMPLPQPGSKFRLKIYSSIAILGFFALMLTYSRILWAALPLGIVLWVLLNFHKKLMLNKPIYLLGCLTTLLLAFGITQYPPIQRRLHDGIGISTRQNLWLANLEFLKQRPLTGVGWHHNQELSGYYLMDKLKTSDVFSGHAHNNFLDLLGSQGMIGAMAWLIWCGCVVWLIILQNKPSLNKSSDKIRLVFGQGLLCAWFVFQINGLTQVNFWEAKVEHQLAWVIAWSLL